MPGMGHHRQSPVLLPPNPWHPASACHVPDNIASSGSIYIRTGTLPPNLVTFALPTVLTTAGQH